MLILTPAHPAGDRPASDSRVEQPDTSNPAVDERPWETWVDDRFRNRGVARLDVVGDRWALTILCDGEHTVYVDDATDVDVRKYEDSFVQADYVYVNHTVPDPRCVRAPCGPVIERRLKLVALAVVTMTDDEAEELRRNCGSAEP